MDSDDPVAKNRASWNRSSDGYQAEHGEQLAEESLAWGVWAIPESQLGVLGDVRGRDVLELGCGAAHWSAALAQRGARPVAMDLSERQLAHARRVVAEAGVHVPLVHGSAERAPFADASFDVVFCDHGATSFARPERTVAEAARLLRPGGTLAFNMSSPLRDVCWDEEEAAITPRLARDYFGLRRLEDADSTCFQLPYGEWIRLFRRHGLLVEDLIEIQPPPGARTSYADYAPLAWARCWPAENIWKLTKAGGSSSR